MQEKWSEANPTCGQCSITAFLVQDIFGGEVYGVSLGDGNYHCFNKVGDAVFDLTSEQFDHPLVLVARGAGPCSGVMVGESGIKRR